MPDVLLTMDSGGSKTRLTLWNIDGQSLREATVQGFGTAVDTQAVQPDLSRILEEFCRKYHILAVVCNLGGKNKTQITNTLLQAFPGAAIRVFRESEGLVGTILCEKTQSQVALLAGTGSIAIGPVENHTVICGGWGANIGDKGSGYDLGLRAIASSLEQIDGTKPLSPLAAYITGVTQPPQLLSAAEYCALRDNVRQRLQPLDRANIAKFSRTVCAFAGQGDPHALSLLQQTGRDLAELVLQAADKTGRCLSRVVVTGGFVHAKAFWQTAFENRLKEKYSIEEVFYLPDGITEAMFTLANNLWK